MEANHKINKVGLRNLHMEDYDQLARSFKRIYADHDVFWTKEQIKKLITIFPEGQVAPKRLPSAFPVSPSALTQTFPLSAEEAQRLPRGETVLGDVSLPCSRPDGF